MLNRYSSADETKEVSDRVFSRLGDALFDKVNYVSNPFSNNGEDYTGTSSFRGWSRITDTSKGKFFDSSKSSRTKCAFYLLNPDDLQGYLLSPAIYDDTSSLNTITSINNINAYVGLKFWNGDVFVVKRDYDLPETQYSTDVEYEGSSFTETKILEFTNTGEAVEVILDGEVLWSGNVDFGWSEGNQAETFLPLLSPVRTSSAAADINIENFQFIQSKI
tara:strand:- start:18583 stop:19239 length:657 start_codon:yes stop_codon:yes gene_type:complete